MAEGVDFYTLHPQEQATFLHDELNDLENRANFYIAIGRFCGYEDGISDPIKYEKDTQECVSLISELMATSLLGDVSWRDEAGESYQGFMWGVSMNFDSEKSCIVSLNVVDLIRYRHATIKLPQLVSLGRLSAKSVALIKTPDWQRLLQ